MVRAKRRAYVKLRKAKKALFNLDKPLFAIVLAWILFGFLIFTSASLGLSAKSTALLSSVLLKQSITLVISFVVMLLVARSKFQSLIKISPYLYAFGILFTLLTFVPGLAFSSGGAHRWINVAGYSVQPAEFMKFTTILFAVYIFIKYKKQIPSVKSLLLPAAVLLPPALVLLAQPDTSTVLVMSFGVGLIYFLFGAPYKNLLIAVFAVVLALLVLVTVHPYVKKRIMTFINPAQDKLGAGYQINQSLIAIGSGGIFGKGFGQGVQKFGYLPEPVGDSIFATLAEEFGLFGALVFVVILSLFVLRALKLALLSRTLAASSVIITLAFTIFIQAFINMAAMTAIMPLTGLTLPLMSLGGSSVLSTLMAIGVIFSAARGVKLS